MILQLFYISTSNFGIYYWNILALALLLIDDDVFPNFSSFLSKSKKANLEIQRIRGKSKFKSFFSFSSLKFFYLILIFLIFVFIAVFSIIPLSTISPSLSPPAELINYYKLIYPWKIVNIYSHPRIPDQRYEIIIQASLDAQTWRDYEFLYKPDSNIDKMLSFVSPHVSRIELLLWRAAQADYQKEIWYFLGVVFFSTKY